jgi:aspartyl protease family protein
MSPADAAATWTMLATMVALLLAAGTRIAAAADIAVIGLMNGKAVVVIDGAKPRTMSAGDTTAGGIRLVSASSDSAVFEIDGKRRSISLGQTIASTYAEPVNPRVTLTADGRGHFITTASINGALTQILVDTGATLIAMNSEDARRSGIDYRRGQPAFASTANGVVRIYKVKLDTVKLGDITLHNIDGAVHEGGSPQIVLLGMSFLSRLEMRREGSTLTLVKKY